MLLSDDDQWALKEKDSCGVGGNEETAVDDLIVVWVHAILLSVIRFRRKMEKC
jgi:hypothetical protein